ncbi:hypothetical protein LINPERHAP2_LOCUS33578, partial [Linum perenne]
MHKLKKPVEEDFFVYEASVVNCWCDLRATRSVRPSELERYFGCPREREEKGCGYYEKLEVQEAVDAAIKEKDQIIRAKDELLVRANREKDDIVEEKDNIIREFIIAEHIIVSSIIEIVDVFQIVELLLFSRGLAIICCKHYTYLCMINYML